MKHFIDAYRYIFSQSDFWNPAYLKIVPIYILIHACVFVSHPLAIIICDIIVVAWFAHEIHMRYKLSIRLKAAIAVIHQANILCDELLSVVDDTNKTTDNKQ